MVSTMGFKKPCSSWFFTIEKKSLFEHFLIGGHKQPVNSCKTNDITKRELGGGFKYFLFSPLLGEMIQFDEHIFQKGGSTTN